jgi:hypothetical protein
MKIRTGFISNSSSSSFLIDATKYSKHKIEQYIKALLEAEDIINGNANIFINDVCTIIENPSAEKYLSEVLAYRTYPKKPTSNEISATMQMYKTSFPGKVVEVHSIGDNSIPWPIQDALERIGRRDHWG